MKSMLLLPIVELPHVSHESCYDLHNSSQIWDQGFLKQRFINIGNPGCHMCWAQLAKLISDLLHQKANTQVIMSHAHTWYESCCAGVAYKNKPSSMLCAVCQSQLSLPQWEGKAHCWWESCAVVFSEPTLLPEKYQSEINVSPTLNT